MTDSPASGLPSEEEEEVRRIVARVMERDNHALASDAARAILALIRPAFEAKEREIERLRTEEGAARSWCEAKGLEPDFYYDGRRTWQEVGLVPQDRDELMREIAASDDDASKGEARALSAEAKLAQAVESNTIRREWERLLQEHDYIRPGRWSPAEILVARLLGNPVPALWSDTDVDACIRARSAAASIRGETT